MTHFAGVEACWHEVQSGTGTARERGEEWVQPATHRKTVTHTHNTRTAAERQTPVNLDKTHSLERKTFPIAERNGTHFLYEDKLP